MIRFGFVMLALCLSKFSVASSGSLQIKNNSLGSDSLFLNAETGSLNEAETCYPDLHKYRIVVIWNLIRLRWCQILYLFIFCFPVACLVLFFHQKLVRKIKRWMARNWKTGNESAQGRFKLKNNLIGK